MESGKTASVWMDSVSLPEVNALESDVQTDVCIVGAGISGLTTAYMLSREGRKVVVIDDGPVGGGETGRTTAHLVNALDDRYYELERMHGRKGAFLAAQSHTAAVDKIEEIVRAENIDCDFLRLDGYLFEPPGGNSKSLEMEHEATHRAGIPTALVDHAPAPFKTGPALRFPRQAQFHPMKYLGGLVRAIQSNGGRIFTGTRAEDFETGKPAKVKTAGGRTITAEHLVVATNTPINDWLVIHSKQAPYRTYVLGFAIERNAIEPILLWDDGMPYHYVRLERASDPNATEDILIIGGEDHKTGQHEDLGAPFGRLEKWTRDRYAVKEVRYRWSGQVMEPADGLGYIGRNPRDSDNIYMITGDSGNGMTHGTLGGMLVTDLIQGRPNEWKTLYDPTRKAKSMSSGSEYVRENVNVAVQYADYLKRGDVSSTDEIKPGQGAIVRRGTHLVAAARDDNGVLHERSAVCTHLGCIVRWNHVEKTWDCPCHGSRFDCQGKILNGPAISPLEELK